ncbi:hypothetical protein DICPUDRAFT_51857 [Dictyostelium purpureum]|uniref:Peptidase C1A papain C-terminal domain-containing protein n=1 Tax=Dictyostelium purpureum TaxID=5786 RepID=F1A5T9_DICPU|nr:uncharacterized protein DICPUDRAFT_51857 [Dictyostelium purpureum]EGC28440.1 hypothetical protein DICPUDRAFT_51857 [Dictyostelium purpureum]|eukprot:XP_003295033.1 hypothetical protein DICPUDRAFT_51857 [Dictyostelium purpureum]
MTYGDVMGMMGTQITKHINKDTKETKSVGSIPQSFDARTQWPNCIHPILNQEQCGSCWAFSASEVLSDRLCIASNGKTGVVLSPQALVSCDIFGNQGCNGGIPQLAWEYMELHGIPTYGCFPYTSGNGTDGSCVKNSCVDNEQYTLYRAKPLTLKTCASVECIQQDIMKFGPIQGTMEVYSDFMSYTSGVYTMTPGSSLLGGHAIKIVGWGFDQASNQNYWIVANSWGPSWGIDGFFWIAFDQCGINSDACAAQARI